MEHSPLGAVPSELSLQPQPSLSETVVKSFSLASSPSFCVRSGGYRCTQVSEKREHSACKSNGRTGQGESSQGAPDF